MAVSTSGVILGWMMVEYGLITQTESMTKGKGVKVLPPTRFDKGVGVHIILLTKLHIRNNASHLKGWFFCG